MSEIPPISGGRADSGIARAQELSAERARNNELTIRVAQLETQLSASKGRNERSTTIRFVVLCLVVLAGLSAIVYLQIDSRGSGQLRDALVQQCDTRNSNIVATRQSLEQQALNNETNGQTEYAQVWRTLAQTLTLSDCRQLR